jgi:hypothetical protein
VPWAPDGASHVPAGDLPGKVCSRQADPALAIACQISHIVFMRIVMGFIVIALFALLIGAVYYAVGIWNALDAADMPGWMYGAMFGGVFFSLLVGGGLMALVFYSSRAGYDDEASKSNFE